MAGSGEDTIDGGEGNDTIHGGDHNDLIEGGAGDDRLFGDSMVDTIRGDDGDDFITFGELLSGSIGEGHGGAGDDWLRVFGTNATTLRGDAGTDLVDIIWALGPVTDHATIDLTAGIASSAGGHALDFDGFERLRTQLGNSDDTVTGGDFDDDIGAGGGANRISGGGGDDRITITMATDAATPDEIRHSQVYGGAGNDHLLIYMGEGAWDRLILDADGSSDGLGGRPLIDGVESVEVVGTNDGATVSLLGTGHNTIYGGDGADTFTTGTGNDSLYGGEGIDTLRGGGGGDALTGGVGADELTGDAGRDFLNGGWGSRDRLWGGAGNDSFYHLGHSGHGTDWVQDYSSAEGDRLLYGDPAANFADFGVIFAASASPDPLNSGAAGVDEAFVVNRATGQILWVLVDGAANEHIWLRIGDEITDLLA
jgi:Ca2+-binding RTX toxin-like protein